MVKKEGTTTTIVIENNTKLKVELDSFEWSVSNH